MRTKQTAPYVFRGSAATERAHFSLPGRGGAGQLMLNVAIAFDAPAPAGYDEAAAAAGACERVIGLGRCAVAGTLPHGAVAAWFALVHVEDGSLSSVTIEFRDRSADGVLIDQRALTFTGREDLPARLVSIGTVIAALAAAREGAVAAETSGPPARSPPRAPDAPAPGPAGEAVSLGLDVAGLAVPALGGGVDRFGGFARANLDLNEPLLFSAGAEYAVGRENPSFGWFTAFAEVGSRVAPRTARYNLELRGGFVYALTEASASVGGARYTATQSAWGGRIGATFLWRPWPRLAFLAGADGTLVTPRVAVAVGSESPIAIDAITCGFFIGLRIYLESSAAK